MKRQTKIELFGLAATALACILTHPALAAPESVTKSEVVRFADLDLSKPEGALTLYKRIQQAARKICGSESYDTRILTPLGNYSNCYHKAMDGAVKHVNHPMLTAIHREETGVKEESGNERVAQGNRR